MKALTKKQKTILMLIKDNPKISFRKLGRMIGRGVSAAQAHTYALFQKGYLASERKDKGAFVLVK